MVYWRVLSIRASVRSASAWPLVICLGLATGAPVLADSKYPAAALYEEAQREIQSNNAADAAPKLAAAAKQGNADAMALLGRLYAAGLGVAQDDAQAVDLVGNAAKLGSAEGEYYFGELRAHGFGTTAPDEAQAFEWFMKAAEQNHAAAQLKVAEWLMDGKGGVKRDDKEAAVWLDKAATSSDPQVLAAVGMHLTETSHAFNDTPRGIRLLDTAARAGNADALYQVGSRLRSGSGVTKDLGLAAEYLNAAAQRSHVQAMSDLAGMYLEGEGVARNAQTAYLLATTAFFLGDESGESIRADALEKLTPEQCKTAYGTALENAKKSHVLLPLVDDQECP